MARITDSDVENQFLGEIVDNTEENPRDNESLDEIVEDIIDDYSIVTDFNDAEANEDYDVGRYSLEEYSTEEYSFEDHNNQGSIEEYSFEEYANEIYDTETQSYNSEELNNERIEFQDSFDDYTLEDNTFGEYVPELEELNNTPEESKNESVSPIIQTPEHTPKSATKQAEHVYKEADDFASDMVNDLIDRMPSDKDYYTNYVPEYADKEDSITYESRTQHYSFVGALVAFFKNYVNFKGYASRSEFWYMVLWGIIASAICSALSVSMMGLGADAEGALVGVALASIITLAILIPSLSLFCRRFHDVGYEVKDALLIFLLPLAGIILFYILSYFALSLNPTGDTVSNSITVIFFMSALANAISFAQIIVLIIVMGGKENKYYNKPSFCNALKVLSIAQFALYLVGGILSLVL